MEAPPTEKDTRWVSFSKQNSRNFTFGEYSRTLRLASELADLRVANADRIPRASARGTVDEGRGVSKAKEHPDGMLFCFGYRLLKRYFYTALNFLLASFTVPLFLSSLNLQTTMKLIERRAV